MTTINAYGFDEITGKRSVNDLNVGLQASISENEKIAAQFEARFAETHDSADYKRMQKALQAVKCQTQALALDDKQKKALLKLFNVGTLVNTFVNSYSVKKLASIAIVLDAGDAGKHRDQQIANWLAKASDETGMVDQRAWKQLFDSATQENQCQTMCERLGLIERIKSGASYVAWERVESKFWDSYSAILESE